MNEMWISLIKALIVALFSLFGVTLNIGCAAMKAEDAAISMAKEVALKIVDKTKLDESAMQAGGSITNPSYEFSFVAGTGFFANGQIRAVGVNATANVTGSGVGEGAADQDMREKLYQISERKDISKEERKKLIADAIADLINRTVIEDKTKTEAVDIKLPTTQPAGKTVLP